MHSQTLISFLAFHIFRPLFKAFWAKVLLQYAFMFATTVWSSPEKTGRFHSRCSGRWHQLGASDPRESCRALCVFPGRRLGPASRGITDWGWGAGLGNRRTLAQGCGLGTGLDFRKSLCESDICSLPKNSIFLRAHMSHILRKPESIIYGSWRGPSAEVMCWSLDERGRKVSVLSKSVLLLSLLCPEAHWVWEAVVTIQWRVCSCSHSSV